MSASDSDTRSRSAGLDGVRGLAALTVFVFHLQVYGTRADGLTGHVLTELRTGLIAFFVLSGFLLYRSFARAAGEQREPVPMRSYLVRRGARILPAYYLSLLGTLALLGAISGHSDVRLPEAASLPLFALFAQNYSPDTIMTLNPVTWTLALEMAFYVLLPVIGLFAFYVARGRTRPQVALLLGLIALGFAWNLAGHLLEWRQPATKALPAYLPYFAAGMLAALWMEARRARGRVPRLGPWTTAALVAGAAALVVGNGFWHRLTPGPDRDLALALMHDMPAAAGFALAVAAVAAGGGTAIAWARARWLRGVGTISYGFYLWHVPLLLFVREVAPVSPDPLVLGVITAPLALAAGAASWFLLERPALAAAGSRLATAPARA